LTLVACLLNAPLCRAASLVLEAEEFRVLRGDWRVGGITDNYYSSTFANTFLCGQMFLGAPEQGIYSEAVMDVEIPEAGDYLVWTRYEHPSYFSVEHGVRIEQGGKAVFDRKYGAFANLKLWPLGAGMKAQALWPWGGGDNIVWEPAEKPLRLKKARARIILYKGSQTRGTKFLVRDGAGEIIKPLGPARRNIDLVYLTTRLDEAHHEQSTTYPLNANCSQDGKVFIRITNPKDARYPITGSLSSHKTHNPYWRYPRGKLPAVISILGAQSPSGPDHWIKPGQSSPWVEIGSGLSSLGLWQEVTFTVNYLVPEGQQAPRTMDVTVEFAADRQGKNVVQSERYRRPGQSFIWELPGNFKRAKAHTVEELHRDLLARLKSFPATGKMPRLIPVYGVLGGFWQGRPDLSEEFLRLRTETGLLLGRNVWKKGEVPPDLEQKYQVPYGKLLQIDVRGVPTAQLEEYLNGIEDKERIRVVSLGDEIGVGSHDPNSKQDNEMFREYLRAEGLTLSDMGLREWTDAKLVEGTKAFDRPKLYYWSQLFGADRDIQKLSQRTAIVEKVLGPGVYTGANYSPHPQYWPHFGQWVRAFRKRGMTMPWSEDYIWQIPEMSPQVTGYLLDVLRSAGKPEKMLIHYYTMPHWPGNTPKDLTLSFYSALAHGNKVLNYFAAVPIYDYTENYISWEATEMWKAIRDLTHDIGLAEDIIREGRVRPSEVAILLSHPTDIWEAVKGSSVYNFERKNIYYALRHAQVPLDFITEDDIIDGSASRKRVIYFVGAHLRRAAAGKLREWVANGGILFSVAGGGFLDEYNQPMDVLAPVYGVRSQSLTVTEKNLWAKQLFQWLRPLARFSYPGAASKLPAFIARQEIEPETATVVGRFDDGKAAVIQNRFGKGSATLAATFPGSAYIHPAIPRRPWDRSASDNGFAHFIPTDFDPRAKSIITAPVYAAGLANGLPVKASNPLVDATVIDSPSGTVVSLANYSGRPIPNLKVKIKDIGRYRSVIAARAPNVQLAEEGNFLSVSLPLEWGDMIIIRR
jgi:hypothetical protein